MEQNSVSQRINNRTIKSLNYTWWNNSISISASDFQEFSSDWNKKYWLTKIMKNFLLCCYNCIFVTKWNTQQFLRQCYVYLPETFSWKITLVPFRKFLPIKNTSSSPFTEQLCKLFFKISGTPAGWAGGIYKHPIRRTTNTFLI